VSPAPAPHGRPDQEEPTDQEQREQEEPARPVADDVHDLHLLAGLLRGLHLLDALRDAGVLAGPVGPDPDADPREDRHDHGCDYHS
jgi:hypothetical protein